MLVLRLGWVFAFMCFAIYFAFVGHQWVWLILLPLVPLWLYAAFQVFRARLAINEQNARWGAGITGSDSFGRMPIARFKDLCIDAAQPHRLGEFWAAVLGRILVEHEDGDAQLDGVQPEERIWVNAVPEPKAVKNRVHLDVVGDPDALVPLGARVVRTPGDAIKWTVMADVEGGEFCVFTRDELPAGHILALIVDAVDAEAQAHWWQRVLGGRGPRRLQTGWWSVGDIPGTPFEELLFIEVPEPKTVKNRVHWDLECDYSYRLVDLGARVLREPDDEIQWRVLADPEGNEFCSFVPKS